MLTLTCTATLTLTFLTEMLCLGSYVGSSSTKSFESFPKKWLDSLVKNRLLKRGRERILHNDRHYHQIWEHDATSNYVPPFEPLSRSVKICQRPPSFRHVRVYVRVYRTLVCKHRWQFAINQQIVVATKIEKWRIEAEKQTNWQRGEVVTTGK